MLKDGNQKQEFTSMKNSNQFYRQPVEAKYFQKPHLKPNLPTSRLNFTPNWNNWGLDVNNFGSQVKLQIKKL